MESQNECHRFAWPEVGSSQPQPQPLFNFDIIIRLAGGRASFAASKSSKDRRQAEAERNVPSSGEAQYLGESELLELAPFDKENSVQTADWWN